MVNTLVQRFKRATTRPQSDNTPQDSEWFGIGNLMRAAKVYNHFKHGSIHAYRRRLFHERFDELLAGHGRPAYETAVMRDGWSLDLSHKNRHLDTVYKDAEDVIARRGMTTLGKKDRRFLRDILQPEDVIGYKSFFDFALSPEVLVPVCNYLGMIPVLSTTVPPAVRLTESSIDGQPDSTYRTSQLYHLDYHDTPLVYVILLLRDVTPESGPFTFLPISTSDKVTHKLRYLRRHIPYRLTDEQVYGAVDRNEARPFMGTKGSLLFIDSSRCFHYGSRDAVDTRYQIMLSFVSPCRTDFTEDNLEPRKYPAREYDSPLARLVLDKYYRLPT
jgi:hypothetical protein